MIIDREKTQVIFLNSQKNKIIEEEKLNQQVHVIQIHTGQHCKAYNFFKAGKHKKNS